MNYDEIMNEINLLEEEIAEEEFGSYAYDCINAELQALYMDLDSLKKDEKKTN